MVTYAGRQHMLCRAGLCNVLGITPSGSPCTRIAQRAQKLPWVVGRVLTHVPVILYEVLWSVM